MRSVLSLLILVAGVLFVGPHAVAADPPLVTDIWAALPAELKPASQADLTPERVAQINQWVAEQVEAAGGRVAIEVGEIDQEHGVVVQENGEPRFIHDPGPAIIGAVEIPVTAVCDYAEGSKANANASAVEGAVVEGKSTLLRIGQQKNVGWAFSIYLDDCNLVKLPKPAND